MWATLGFRLCRKIVKGEKGGHLRDQFPGYYQRTEEELERIWRDGLFVLDANVLLNPYRYSEDTRNELLKILRGAQDRLWIPYQVAEEFHRNRLDVIRGQKKAYPEVRNSLSEARRQVESRVKAIHKDSGIEAKSLLEKVRGAFDELVAETKRLEEESGACSVPESYSPEGDEIWKEVIGIVEGRVGKGLSPERMEEVRREGHRRYASEVPPGYEDIDKPGDRQFGDLILWYEIIDKAKEAEKPVLLVTDDRKEDWWQRSGGKALEPHPDLANEIHQKVGVLFHMMLPLKFLKWVGSKLKEEISQKAAEEIEEIRSLEEPEDTLDESSAVGIAYGERYVSPAHLEAAWQRAEAAERFNRYDPDRVLRQIEQAEQISKMSVDEYLKRYDPEEQIRRIERIDKLIRRLDRMNEW